MERAADSLSTLRGSVFQSSSATSSTLHTPGSLVSRIKPVSIRTADRLQITALQHQVRFEVWTTLFAHRVEFSQMATALRRVVDAISGLHWAVADLTARSRPSSSVGSGEAVEGMVDNEVVAHVLQTSTEVLAALKEVLADRRMPMDHIADTLNGCEEDLRAAQTQLTDMETSMQQRCPSLFVTERRQEQRVSDACTVAAWLPVLTACRMVADDTAELAHSIHVFKEQVEVRRGMGRLAYFWKRLRTIRSSESSRPLLPSSRFPLQDSVQAEVVPRDTAVTCLWKALHRLSQFEYKFAFKTATTIALMAVPAFIENLQDSFYEYRLNWAMTSAIVILTPSVGGSVLQGLYRAMGTVAGMCVSILVWYAASSFKNTGDHNLANPLLLFVLSTALAVPAFMIYLHSKYAKLGQIFLLTFSIVVLSEYAAPVDPVTGKSYSVVAVALRRGTAVLLGVVVGLFVSWYVWPFKARDALRLGVGSLLMETGRVYTGLLRHLTGTTETHVSHCQSLTNMHSEIPRLRQLAEQTRLEPRWKGLFPATAYLDLLDIHTRLLEYLSLLDRSLLSKAPLPVARSNDQDSELNECLDGIFLVFYTLAQSQTHPSHPPLPPSLPDVCTFHATITQLLANSATDHKVQLVMARLQLEGLSSLVEDIQRIQSKLVAVQGTLSYY